LALAVLASPLPYFLGTLGPTYLLAVLPADGLLCYGAYEGFDDPGRGQAYLKAGMFLAAGAFVLGRLAVL
jgi:geranylgeranylglycerol-phosphate geranylgeranyltransferase